MFQTFLSRCYKNDPCSNDNILFQEKTPENFRFYRLTFGFEEISTTYISYNSHITLNKKLPEEIIRKIVVVAYLSIKDILHLCISKVFLPCLVNSPWFFELVNTYFSHLLGTVFAKSKFLFIICTLRPAIINNMFYFSVDHAKLPYFKSFFQGKYTIFELNLFKNCMKILSILFQPYKQFKKKSRYYLKTIQSFPTCHNFCPCLQYRFCPFSYVKLTALVNYINLKK